MKEHEIAAAYQPVEFRLSNGISVQVTLRDDEDEVSVMLFGRQCGELIVVPSAGNSIRVKASGPGIKKGTSHLLSFLNYKN